MLSKVSYRLILPTTESAFLPFLYETRTLKTSPLPLPLHKRSSRVRSRCYSTRTAPAEASSEGITYGDTESSDKLDSSSPSSADNASAQQTSFLKKKAAAASSSVSPPKSSSKLKSTVTRTEKQIFDRLFAKLGTSPPPQLDVLASSKKRKEEQEKPISSTNTLSSSDSAADESAQISAIFEESIEELKRRAEHEPGSGSGTASSANSFLQTSSPVKNPVMEEAGRLYRKIHSYLDAVPRDGDPSQLEENPDRMETSRLIKIVVKRESEKIEKELRRAIKEGKGDLGLWKVCEERIFGMLGQLEEGSDGPEQPSSHDRSGQDTVSFPAVSEGRESKDTGTEGRKAAEGSATDQQDLTPNSTSLEIPPYVPRTAVISSVYSHMLLVAFHLLRTHFPNSPLIAEIRPTIQSYGRTSVVLGASTKLYNELIRFYWRVCDDLPAVVSLLREMEVTGAQPDAKTYKLLRALITQRERERWKYIRQERLRRQGLGRQDLHDGNGSSTTTWMETVPNMYALRELRGSGSQQGWVERIRLRLNEIGRFQREDRKVKQDLEEIYSDDVEDGTG